MCRCWNNDLIRTGYFPSLAFVIAGEFCCMRNAKCIIIILEPGILRVENLFTKLNKNVHLMIKNVSSHWKLQTNPTIIVHKMKMANIHT